MLLFYTYFHALLISNRIILYHTYFVCICVCMCKYVWVFLCFNALKWWQPQKADKSGRLPCSSHHAKNVARKVVHNNHYYTLLEFSVFLLYLLWPWLMAVPRRSDWWWRMRLHHCRQRAVGHNQLPLWWRHATHIYMHTHSHTYRYLYEH